jgi:hypothetical protein
MASESIRFFRSVLSFGLFCGMVMARPYFGGYTYYGSLIVGGWLLTLLIWLNRGPEKRTEGLLYAYNAVIIYSALAVGMLIYDRYLEYRLNLFDLDGDLIFSPAEQTVEQKYFFDLVTNDGERRIILIAGLIYTAISTIGLFLIVSCFNLFRKEAGSSKGQQNQQP